MPYRCSACGQEFTSAQDFISHKLLHQAPQEPPQGPRGVVCLGCGQPIPTPPNYSGFLSCPSCKRSMRVVVEEGEVVSARLMG